MPQDYNRMDEEYRGGDPAAGKASREAQANRPNYLPLIIIVTIFAMIFLLHNPITGDGVKHLSMSEFQEQYDNDNIKSIVVRGEETVEGEFYSAFDEKTRYTVEVNKAFIEDNQKDWQARNREMFVDKPTGRVKLRPIQVKADRPSIWFSLLLNIIPYLLLIVLFWWLLFRQFRGPSGSGGILNFGRSRAMLTKEKTGISFNDVAGIDEAKEEVKEIVEFLRKPEKFRRMGAHIPHGVLLIGPPGTGKTLLAKAIAGEAGVPFFSISGSDFVEMFVGVGASRVRDLFKRAKENSPCIIFLDEIDAVGRKRGAGFGGGNDEREQTLNAILVEMDGFDTDEGVIVIAATNRPDVLDPALRRPGRFDREIQVDLPDIEGREQILRVHAKKVTLDPGVDLKVVARGTPTFSGAELENLINEAALLAAIRDKTTVTLDELEEARDKVRWGRQKKNRVMAQEDQATTAYHEAGHAIATSFLENVDPLHKVSIIPRGMALGATMSLPEKDMYGYGRKQLLNKIKELYGGRIAEELFCKDITTGAENDIERATHIASMMVTEWGMSESLGPVNYGKSEDGIPVWAGGEGTGRPMSEDLAQKIDAEIRGMLMICYQETKDLLTTHRHDVEQVAKALMRYESLSADEVKALIAGTPIDTLKPEPTHRVLKTPDEAAEARKREQEKAKKDVLARSESVQDQIQIRPKPMDA